MIDKFSNFVPSIEAPPISLSHELPVLSERPLKPVLVSENTAIQLCGLSGRTRMAAKKAFQRLRGRLRVKKFPGGVFSYEQLQNAVRRETAEKILNRRKRR